MIIAAGPATAFAAAQAAMPSITASPAETIQYPTLIVSQISSSMLQNIPRVTPMNQAPTTVPTSTGWTTTITIYSTTTITLSWYHIPVSTTSSQAYI